MMLSTLILSPVLTLAILACFECTLSVFAFHLAPQVDACNIDKAPKVPIIDKAREWVEGLDLTPELAHMAGLGTIAIFGDHSMIGAGLIFAGSLDIDYGTGAIETAEPKRIRVKWEKAYSGSHVIAYETTISGSLCCVQASKVAGCAEAYIDGSCGEMIDSPLFIGVNAVSKAKQWASKTARKLSNEV